ncbi:MAG: hypothetical protein PVI90_10350 [Desulfobacteraceae bacterium]|jgi:hypothetical protein
MISKTNIPLKQSCDKVSTTQKKQYYSVEFTLDEIVPLYQFKLRKNQTMNLFVLVKEDSKILNGLKVGRVLNMKYYSADTSYPPEYRTTLINNIINDKNGRFSGHCMVGLSILPTHQPPTQLN